MALLTPKSESTNWVCQKCVSWWGCRCACYYGRTHSPTQSLAKKVAWGTVGRGSALH